MKTKEILPLSSFSKIASHGLSLIIAMGFVSVQSFSACQIIFADEAVFRPISQETNTQNQPTQPKAPYVTSETAKNWLNEGKKVVFVDVREGVEYKKGHIEGAVNIPYSKVEKKLNKFDKTKEAIIFYCISSSWRAPYVANLLADKGFTNVYILEGGIAAWKGEGQTIRASKINEPPDVAAYPKGLKIALVHPRDRQYKEKIVLTAGELKLFNGKDGHPAYVAIDGVVYDVTQSRLWRGGVHAPGHGKIFAGRDLTEEIKDSPHGAKELTKFPVVGKLTEMRTQ